MKRLGTPAEEVRNQWYPPRLERGRVEDRARRQKHQDVRSGLEKRTN